MNLFNKHKILYAIFPFSYGFARSINGECDPPYDVLGHRILFATLNGSLYAVPPYTFFYTIKLINRIDIRINNKNPKEYRDCYEDLFCFNKNTFI